MGTLVKTTPVVGGITHYQILVGGSVVWADWVDPSDSVGLTIVQAACTTYGATYS